MPVVLSTRVVSLGCGGAARGALPAKSGLLPARRDAAMVLGRCDVWLAVPGARVHIDAERVPCIEWLSRVGDSMPVEAFVGR